MATLQKKMKKGKKALGRKRNTGRCLTLVQSYNVTTALYEKKSKKPLFSINARGNYRISVFKLVLILLAVGSVLTAAILALRAFFEQRRRKAELEEAAFFCDYNDDEELPF